MLNYYFMKVYFVNEYFGSDSNYDMEEYVQDRFEDLVNYDKLSENLTFMTYFYSGQRYEQ